MHLESRGAGVLCPAWPCPWHGQDPERRPVELGLLPFGDWGRSSEPAEVPPAWDPLPGSRAVGGASQFSPEFRQALLKGLVQGSRAGLRLWARGMQHRLHTHASAYVQPLCVQGGSPQ